MTLIELLVVLVIILVVAAATISQLRPTMDRSRVREAARSIQLYLSSARNQAMATGRPCGVMIERLPAENGCSMSLAQVETPPLYGGDTTTSFATVTQSQASSGGYAYCNITLPAATSFALHVGDLFQLGYQGLWITLVTQSGGTIPAGATQLSGIVDISHGETPPWTVQPITGPFNIIRMPAKSAAAALQLPSPACIDLTWSGVDQVLATDPLTWGIDGNPVMIVFAANGSVDKIYVTGPNGYSWARATSAIYLLVGRRDHVDNPQNVTDANCNIYDLNNLWIAINASTGLIVVTDNAAYSGPPANATLAAVCQQTRTFARQSLANGGK